MVSASTVTTSSEVRRHRQQGLKDVAVGIVASGGCPHTTAGRVRPVLKLGEGRDPEYDRR